MIDFVNRVTQRKERNDFEKEQHALEVLSRATDTAFARVLTAKLIPERVDRHVIRRVTR